MFLGVGWGGVGWETGGFRTCMLMSRKYVTTGVAAERFGALYSFDPLVYRSASV